MLKAIGSFTTAMKKLLKYLVVMAAALTCASCKTSTKEMEINRLLVVVDVQRDFFDPAGSLYVSGSEALPEKNCRYRSGI